MARIESGRRMMMMLPLFALAVATFPGCSFDPEKSVTIEITRKLSDDERKEISEKLKTMTDADNHLMRVTYSGNKTTITLQPVSDPAAFAKKIDFGDVTAVEGHTIHVSIQSD